MNRRYFTALCCLLSIATTVSAHRFHAGLTDINLNPRSGKVEVVHTYMTHDLEHWLSKMHQTQADLSLPANQALLRRYLQKNFVLRDKAGKSIGLQWVGVKAGVDSVLIYQEATMALDDVAAVQHQVLMDFLPDQVNTVNVGQGKHFRTFTFTRRSTTVALH